MLPIYLSVSVSLCILPGMLVLCGAINLNIGLVSITRWYNNYSCWGIFILLWMSVFDLYSIYIINKYILPNVIILSRYISFYLCLVEFLQC